MTRPGGYTMRRLLLGSGSAGLILLAGTTVASAATSTAGIVDCLSATWCFSPNPISVPAGSRVSWTNASAFTHTATSDTGAWTTGNIAAGATSAALTFTTPGTFSYHCAIHPFMTGTLLVTAAIASGPPTASPAPLVKRLAPGGAGPQLPAAAILILLGLGLLRLGRLRRRLRRGR